MNARFHAAGRCLILVHREQFPLCLPLTPLLDLFVDFLFEFADPLLYIIDVYNKILVKLVGYNFKYTEFLSFLPPHELLLGEARPILKIMD